MTATRKTNLFRLGLAVVLALALILAWAGPNQVHAATKSGNAYAKSVKTSVGQLTPKFSKKRTAYTVNLTAEQSSTKLTFKKAHKKAKVKVKIGDGKWSKNWSSKVSIAKKVTVAAGESLKVKFKVKPPKGKTKTYTVAVTRAAAPVPPLPVKAPTPAPVPPTADPTPSVTKYTLTVVNGTGSGQYEAGEKVHITVPSVNPQNNKEMFYDWAVNPWVPGTVYFEPNYSSYDTHFIMPAYDIIVTPLYA